MHDLPCKSTYMYTQKQTIKTGDPEDTRSMTLNDPEEGQQPLRGIKGSF